MMNSKKKMLDVLTFHFVKENAKQWQMIVKDGKEKPKR